MSILGNIIWFIFGGLILGMGYILAGLLCCITIIGIPFGVQLIKIGIYTFLPFGNDISIVPENQGCITLAFNILWIIFGWWEIALVHFAVGLIFCITIIGIPFGVQHFKIAVLSFLPFGRQVF